MSSSEEELIFGQLQRSKKRRLKKRLAQQVLSDSETFSSEASDASEKGKLHDAITTEDIGERLHFTWRKPNGENFTYLLSTLVKCAGNRVGCNYISSIEWKEPPLFRSVATDETKQKILDVFPDEMITQAISHSRRVSDPQFSQQLSGYCVRLLPKKDLYTCPICFTQVSNEDNNSVSALKDPLELLGMISSDVGAMFLPGEPKAYCFSRKVVLFQHLENFHQIPKAQTRQRRLGPLFDCHKIRATDGLVQRYWFQHQTTGNSRVQQYWSQDLNRVAFFAQLVEMCQKFNGSSTAEIFMQEERSAEIWDELTSEEDNSDQFIHQDTENETEDGFLSHARQLLQIADDDSSQLKSLALRYKEADKQGDCSSYSELSEADEKVVPGRLKRKKRSLSHGSDSSLESKDIVA